MLRKFLKMLNSVVFSFSCIYAVPDLPLLTNENGHYVPIPESQWLSNMQQWTSNKQEINFNELNEDERLRVCKLYKEMRIEYLYGEYRGEFSDELTDLIETLAFKLNY